MANNETASDAGVPEEYTLGIQAISMRDAQNVQGLVVGFVNAEKMGVTITMSKDGVRIKGTQTNKLVPYSNIRSIDFEATETSKPVVGTR